MHVVMDEQIGLHWADKFARNLEELDALADYTECVIRESEVYDEYALYCDEMED